MHKLKPFLPGTKELYCLQVQIILTGLITKEVALSYLQKQSCGWTCKKSIQDFRLWLQK